MCEKLINKGFSVVVQDYMVDAKEVKRHYGFEVNNTPEGEFDAIVLAVDHEDYKHLSYYDHLKNGNQETVIFDVKGNKKDKFPKRIYMSLSNLFL